MKAAIVTGASGFIGQVLTRELLGNGYEVYAVARKESAVPAGCVPVVCDLREADKLAGLIPQRVAEVFYHLAWDGVSGSDRKDEKLQLASVQWTVDCVRAAKKLGCRRFVCAGTISEYETTAGLLNFQGGSPEERWGYGAAKALARALGLRAAFDLGLDGVWATITNAYGVGDRSRRIIAYALRQILTGQPPEFSSGLQHYDFIYIDDVAKAFRLIGERGRPFHTYAISSGEARPLRDFLLEMKAALSPDLEFHFGALPVAGQGLPLSAPCFDAAATEADTGFRAQVDFIEGCRRTYEWLKKEEGHALS